MGSGLRGFTYSINRNKENWIFGTMSGLVVVLLLILSLYDQLKLGVFLPLALFLGYMAIFKIRNLFYLVFFLIPFSIEYSISNSLGTDLPTEPLLIILAVITVFLSLVRMDQISVKQVLHPVSFLVLMHLICIAFTALFAENQIVSFKFLAAKIWYVLPFFVLPFFLDFNRARASKLFHFLVLGSLMAASYFFYCHLQEGLTFEARTNAGAPLFRNHVNYACLLVLMLPVVGYLRKRAKDKAFLFFCIWAVLIVFIYFSYARIAYLCIGTLVGTYYLIKWRLIKQSLIVGLFTIIGLTIFLARNNHYLSFAPNYEKTVAQHRFDRLLTATYQLEDISSMERVYRWLAGFEMARKRPWLGYGPGNFFQNYKNHTTTSFKTYVSRNPDRSGVHNYFLMTLSEQGIPGLAIFLLLIIVSLLVGEKTYHRHSPGYERDLVMLGVLLIAGIATMNLLNDMYEVIKVGPFFFFALYLIQRGSERNDC